MLRRRGSTRGEEEGEEEEEGDGWRGGEINRQLIQVYRRYQTAALSMQAVSSIPPPGDAGSGGGGSSEVGARRFHYDGINRELRDDFLRFCDSTIR